MRHWGGVLFQGRAEMTFNDLVEFHCDDGLNDLFSQFADAEAYFAPCTPDSTVTNCLVCNVAVFPTRMSHVFAVFVGATLM